jgi:hypothetical protein
MISLICLEYENNDDKLSLEVHGGRRRLTALAFQWIDLSSCRSRMLL